MVPSESTMVPSDVNAEMQANPPSTPEQVEEILQRVLAVLSTLDPPETMDLNHSIIWKYLNGGNMMTMVDGHAAPPMGQEEEDEWIVGLDLLGKLLMRSDKNLLPSPFEIHALATQACVFSETAYGPYMETCLLLCCLALWKCQPRVTSRPKRWRSLLFETIRLVQQHLEDLSITFFSNHILPACMHVRKALPEGTEPIDWVECFQISCIQMLSLFAAQAVREDGSDDQNNRTIEYNVEILCKAADTVMDGRFEMVLHARYFLEEELRQQRLLSQPKLLKRWMSGMVHEDDRELLASVKTEVDEAGLSMLSHFWLEWPGRSQVYNHTHLWHLVFPGVAILLNSDDSVEYRFVGFLLIQRLVSMIGKASLATPSPRRPDYPLGTFQLMLNHVVAKAAMASSTDNGQPSSDSLPSSVQTFQLIKQLLSKYVPVEQVRLVMRLHPECPHLALKPKICDLLRDMVTWTDTDALSKAWSFLETRLQSLEAYIRDDGGEDPHLVDVDDLVLEAEDYVAVLGLIRSWSMVVKTAPSLCNLATRVSLISKATARTIEMQNSDDIFRLELLQSSSQLVLESLEDVMEIS